MTLASEYYMMQVARNELGSKPDVDKSNGLSTADTDPVPRPSSPLRVKKGYALKLVLIASM